MNEIGLALKIRRKILVQYLSFLFLSSNLIGITPLIPLIKKPTKYIPRRSSVLKKLIVSQPVKKSQVFKMHTDGSLPCSQDLVTGPETVSHESSQHRDTVLFTIKILYKMFCCTRTTFTSTSFILAPY